MARRGGAVSLRRPGAEWGLTSTSFACILCAVICLQVVMFGRVHRQSLTAVRGDDALVGRAVFARLVSS